MSDFLDAVLTPFDYVVSAPLLAWHEIFSGVLGAGPGWAWALAIVGTAVTIRVLMLPLYLRQLRVRREMRKLQPEFKDALLKYGHDRDRLMQEHRRLWKATGANPYLSSVPWILQGLVLLVLFRILDASTKYASADGSFRRGFITETAAVSLSRAKILGAGIADTLLDASNVESQMLAAGLIVAVCVAQLVAQRQQRIAMPDIGLDEVYANQQRFLIFSSLVVFAAFGLILPIGGLIFWVALSVWTVVQQHVMRDDPGPVT